MALIVEALTDNRNRTAGAVRSYFAKHGGALGETGSVAFMFDRVGEIVYPASAGSADAVLEAAIEAGADDVASDAERHVVSPPSPISARWRARWRRSSARRSPCASIWKPQTLTPVEGDKAETLMKLIGALEDDDDVQNVFANYDLDESTLQQLSAA